MDRFEALGRYTETAEEAKDFAQQRNRLLSELKLALQLCLGTQSSGCTAEGFDFAAAMDKLKKAEARHNAMLKAVAAANAVADDCGRPKLKVG